MLHLILLSRNLDILEKLKAQLLIPKKINYKGDLLNPNDVENSIKELVKNMVVPPF